MCICITSLVLYFFYHPPHPLPLLPRPLPHPNSSVSLSGLPRTSPAPPPVGVYLSKEEMKLNICPLLRLVCQRFFGGHHGFVDMCVRQVPSPIQNAAHKVGLGRGGGVSVGIVWYVCCTCLLCGVWVCTHVS